MNIVTFDQAKKMKELGYCDGVFQFYNETGVPQEDSELIYKGEKYDTLLKVSDFKTDQNKRNRYSAPSVPEALQWIRDTFKITCTVEIDWDDSIEGYSGVYCTKGRLKWLSFCFTYPEAESELLTQILEYLEKKED